jgi:hypothetical protein
MGVGLLAAVLGFGSTFAANISINSPEGTSEFGQGVTQTIYCGADEPTSVKVTPASSYTNSPATKTLSNAKFITVYSSYASTLVNPVTIYGYGSSNLPRFSLSSNTVSKVGWWLNGSLTTSTPVSPQPTFEQVYASPGSYYFAERYSDGNFKKPASAPLPVNTDIVMSDELSNFKLGKVVISNIPTACNGVDFVISTYGASGSAKELSSSGSSIYEAAVLWNGGGTSYPSKSRTSFQDTRVSYQCQVTSSQTSNSLTYTFTSPVVSVKDLNKLVIETQEDAIGAGSCGW